MRNNIPKTTKFTLKRIIENLDNIPNNGFGEEVKRLTPDQKRKLMEMTAMFENFGESIKNEEAIVNSAKGLTELCELAEQYALNECGDVFQKNIVQKDMKDLKRRVTEYNKIAKECYARMQQLGTSYQDIGHILERYYSLKKAKGLDQAGVKQPLQMDEGDRICSWCKKKMGNNPDVKGGDTHTICPDCMKKHFPEDNDPMKARRQPDPDMSHYMGDGDRS